MNDFMQRYGKVEAKLLYADADFSIIKPGAFVHCAITKKSIALDELKYWNVDRQEAYADVDAATIAYLKYK